MSDTLNAKVPYDLQLENEQLNDRRALVQALMQRAMTPNNGQMVGQHYVAPNALGSIGAPIAQALMAKQMKNQNQATAADLANRYKGAVTGEEKFGHTPVKMRGPDGQLADVLIGDRGSVKPITTMGPAEEQAATAGGQLYGKFSGKPGSWLGEQFGPSQIVNGEAVQFDNRSNKAHQVANRPANVAVSAVNAGQKTGAQEYFKNAAQQVSDIGKQANASQGLLSTIGTLRELHNAGIHSNVTSDMAVAASNLAQSMGMKVDPSKLANTETYNSLITDLWQRSVAQYGGNRGVTQSEAEEIKKLTPLARTSPQAREQLFAIHEAAAKRSINAYRQANDSFAKAAAADDPRLFQIPTDIADAYVPQAGNTPNPKVTPQGKPSVSNW